MAPYDPTAGAVCLPNGNLQLMTNCGGVRGGAATLASCATSTGNQAAYGSPVDLSELRLQPTGLGV